MITDITVGRYYAACSAVHDLDPRTKLMAALVYIVSLFLVRNPLSYLLCLAVLLSLYHLAHVPMRYLLRGMRPILLLLIFTFLFRTFFSSGTPLWGWWVFQFTWNGFHKAVRLVSRIALMIAGASLLSYTTTPKRLADGLEKALSGLKKFHFPVEDLALMVTIAFRFIPVFNEEIGILMDAQASRGVDFERGGIWAKIKRIPSLVIPLFVSAMRRSSDLATAMEARGCSGENVCTKMYPLEYSTLDYRTYVLMLVYAAAIFAVDRFLLVL